MRYLVPHLVDPTLKAERFAARTAIEQGDILCSYAELDRLADRFRIFLEDEGLKPGTLVGLCSRARIEAVAAMIGCLRAGLVYVPLNIQAPPAWIGNVVRKSGITLALVDPEFAGKSRELGEFGLKRTVFLGSEAQDLREGETAFSRVEATPITSRARPNRLADDLCWVLYTSGSTGDPKGVMISHRNAFTFIDWMKEEFTVGEEDRIFNRAPLQFDLSVFDIFSTFMAGGTLVLAPLGFDGSAESVVTYMRDKRISIIYTVPSAFIAMLTRGGLDRGVPTLRQILYAGEPFSPAYLARVMECLPHTKVSNIYGPTETNIVTYFHLKSPPKGDEQVPIGLTVQDTEAYIVDENLKLVPEGELGEILIRGSTVFVGYFNDPELTQKRLVQSPFHNYPTLCCRTGDYGRLLPDGNILYHGRMDNMVKTRGYRVELGEVESALARCAGVDEVAVVPRPHEKYGNALHAYLVLGSGTSLEAVKEELSRHIPSYMLPFEYHVEASLPKTSTGKVDRVTLAQRLARS